MASISSNILTYGTTGLGTATAYRSNTPLPDALSFPLIVRFRVKVVADASGGLGDSQIRMGFQAPGVALALGLATTPGGDRQVRVIDLQAGKTLGALSFDFLDGNFHVYQLTRAGGVIDLVIDP